jgi:hypothetical protein
MKRSSAGLPENDSPVKRLEVWHGCAATTLDGQVAMVLDGKSGDDGQLDDKQLSKGALAQLLRGAVAKLVVDRHEPTFPLHCVRTVRREIAPMLDSDHNIRDSIILRRDTGPGRSLALILMLAAACATVGMGTLRAERAQYDLTRLIASRNWLSYTKATKRTYFSRFTLNRWSSIKECFNDDQPVSDSDEYDDSEATELDESIIKCFQEHDVMSISTLDGVDFDLCDGCGASFNTCGQRFYRCEICDLDVCATCEERRVNYQ